MFVIITAAFHFYGIEDLWLFTGLKLSINILNKKFVVVFFSFSQPEMIFGWVYPFEDLRDDAINVWSHCVK